MVTKSQTKNKGTKKVKVDKLKVNKGTVKGLSASQQKKVRCGLIGDDQGLWKGRR